LANFPGVEAAIPVRLAARLRAAGIGAEVFPEPIQIGKQMGYGSTRGHRFAVIVGPDERDRQVFNLRNLATRKEEKAIGWGELEARVEHALESASASGSSEGAGS
jgi:histidyl-tRNA synthetase